MSLGVAVLVFLVGSCLGVLLGVLIALERMSRRLEAMRRELTELGREGLEIVKKSEAERRRHAGEGTVSSP